MKYLLYDIMINLAHKVAFPILKIRWNFNAIQKL